MLRQLALATWCETRHFEKTALRFACPELQIVLSVSLNALPRGVFKVIEYDITGNRLFTCTLRIEASEGAVVSPNADALVNWHRFLRNVNF